MKTIKRIFTAVMAVCLSFSILSIRPQAASPFTDVTKKTSGYTQIMWAYKQGLIKGVGHKKFNPTGTLTKAQITVMIWRYFGEERGLPDAPYTDIGSLSDNVRAAINWSYYYGLVDPSSSTKFGPKVKVTRKVMTTILWRCFGKETPGVYSPFTDINSLPSETQQAIIWCYENSITAGTSKTKFSPNSYCTRAQFCIFLYRFDETMGYKTWNFSVDGNAFFTMKLPESWTPYYADYNNSDGWIDVTFYAVNASGKEMFTWEFSNGFGTGYFPYNKSISVGQYGTVNVMYQYYKGEGTYAQIWYNSGEYTWGGWLASSISSAQFLKIIKTIKMKV